ncbi:MAG: ABC transporter permease [Firmicutes bacterium]|nr:ABC transporter permease [Bacillota bacterium]
MLKLIKIELKKFNIKKYANAAFISNIFILALACIVIYASYDEGSLTVNLYSQIIEFIRAIINVTFIVFSGVLISSLIIGEFKSKTVNVLFSYPISRQKLILAKLLIVIMFTFISIIFSNIIIVLGVSLIQKLYPVLQINLFLKMFIYNFSGVITSAIFTSIMSIIPLYFGLRKKSVSTTIVTSILLATITNSSGGAISLSSIVIIPIVLSILGVILIYSKIVRNIENKDIL